MDEHARRQNVARFWKRFASHVPKRASTSLKGILPVYLSYSLAKLQN
jgi:hypothetical protein